MLSRQQILIGIAILFVVALAITLIIVLTRPKPRPNYPTYFKAYVEDCQDVPTSYNLQTLKKLDILGLDFSKACYGDDKALLGNLQDFNGKIFIHFDQTKGAETCGTQPSSPSMDSKIFSACAKTAKDELGDNLVEHINGVLWEKEGNKFVNACENEDCKSAFSTAFNRKMLFAGWKFFGGAWESLPSNWDYQFIEMYNIYNQCGSSGGDNCKLDYNPNYKFNPAVCGPPSSSGCEYGKQGMYSNALTIKQQATWLATIFKDQPKPAVPNPEKTVIFFPFTDASKPSFKNIITTEEQFNEFVQTFIDVLKDTSPGIEKCMYGAWGAPKWIYGS